MTEYIDRDSIGICRCNPDVFEDKGYAKGWNAAIDIIQNAPAADVRPVVRCAECVYAYPWGLEIKCTKHSGHADKFGEDASYQEYHSKHWFCADGEERKHE